LIVFAVVVGVVALFRLFAVGSYRITSDIMSNTLKAGDLVLVNKVKSKINPGRNRLVLYESPLMKDAARPPLFIGRCIGVPGDVIQMGADGFRVNGRLLPNAPMMQQTFRVRKNIKERLLTTMESLLIPLRDIREDSVSLTIRLSLREKELLVQNLPSVVAIEPLTDDQRMGYEFSIPRKDRQTDMNETMLMACREAMMHEADTSSVEIRDGKLYIDGVEKSSFVFRNDYYWILSENETEGVDSRHLGLIPKKHIIGNIWYCWYSRNPSRRFTEIR
jgi:signal peptidase I